MCLWKRIISRKSMCVGVYYNFDASWKPRKICVICIVKMNASQLYVHRQTNTKLMPFAIQCATAVFLTRSSNFSSKHIFPFLFYIFYFLFSVCHSHHHVYHEYIVRFELRIVITIMCWLCGANLNALLNASV